MPDPVATAVTAWAHDPFNGGSYSCVPRGADPWMIGLLAQPVHPRLLFAGKHTSARDGYADGAYSTGLRAAAQLGTHG